MKNILFLLVTLFIFSCKKDETVTEPTKIISANFWKLDRFADTDGKTLSQNQLNSQAQALFGLDYEFRDDNVTRAKGPHYQANSECWNLVFIRCEPNFGY